MAVVGLQRTFYSVDEDDGMVEVCLSVIRPSIGCPVTYPFDVLLITVADTAGKHMISLWHGYNCGMCASFCSQWKVMIMDDSLIWSGLPVVSEDAVSTSLLLMTLYWKMSSHSM